MKKRPPPRMSRRKWRRLVAEHSCRRTYWWSPMSPVPRYAKGDARPIVKVRPIPDGTEFMYVAVGEIHEEASH